MADKCGWTHANYPHEPGRLPGCLACEFNCHCNKLKVALGVETECVWLGHEEAMRREQEFGDG